MRNAMVLSLAGFVAVTVPLAHFAGNHGLRAGLVVFMVFRALTLAYYYPALRRGAGASAQP